MCFDIQSGLLMVYGFTDSSKFTPGYGSDPPLRLASYQETTVESPFHILYSVREVS